MTVSRPLTIKDQLWATILANVDERGRLQIEIDELGKRHGLNGHDLAKNLDQMGKEGLVDVRWKGDRMVGLRTKRRPKSTNERVYNWLAGRNVMGAWIEATPNQIRDSLGLEGNTVSVAVSDLLRTNRIQARRAENGRSIVALRIPSSRPEVVVVDEQSGSLAVANGGSTITQLPTKTMPATPNLDSYLSARRIARLAPDHNPYLTVEFTENPIAEEALVLRQALARALGL